MHVYNVDEIDYRPHKRLNVYYILQQYKSRLHLHFLHWLSFIKYLLPNVQAN